MRGSWSIGHVGDDDNSTGLEQSGWFTTGGHLGIAVLPQLTIGPSFEVGGLARLGSWYDTREHQGAFLLAPGARVQMFLPIQDNKELTLRYDARALLFQVQGAYATSITHGLAIGLSFR